MALPARVRYYEPMSNRRAASTAHNELLLLLVPMLWGLGYPLIRGSMDAIGPLGFLHWRFLAALLPLGVLLRREIRRIDRKLLGRGLITGIALFFAYAFLNWGLVHTTTAKAGFIIGLRVILVPITGALLFRLRAALSSWAAALVSLAGLAFIFFGDFDLPLTLNPGDGLMVASAFFFAVHVLLVARYVVPENYAPLLLLQLAAVVVLSAGGALLFERQVLPAEPTVWPRALAAGGLSTALAFWLQNRFQHESTPDRAGVIFSSEPLFAALFGFFFLDEMLHGWQWAGAVLIVAAMALARLPRRRR
jgi:drug/metabolite transporter (DMT)-like permease